MKYLFLVFLHIIIYSNILFLIPAVIIFALSFYFCFGMRDSNIWSNWYNIILITINLLPIIFNMYIKIVYAPNYLINYINNNPNSKYANFILDLNAQQQKKFLKKLATCDLLMTIVFMAVLYLFFNLDIISAVILACIMQIISAGGLGILYTQMFDKLKNLNIVWIYKDNHNIRLSVKLYILNYYSNNIRRGFNLRLFIVFKKKS